MRLPGLFRKIFAFWILLTAAGDNIIITPPRKEVIVNKGADVKFVCQVHVPESLQGEEMRIKWKHNGHYILSKNKSDKYTAEENGQTLHVRRVDGADAGTYRCFVHFGVRTGYSRDYATRTLIVREPPDPPRDVSIITCSGNSVVLQWQPGNLNDKVLHYLVQFNTTENPNHWNNYNDELIPGDVQTFNINLSPWGTYSFRLLARNEVDYSAPSPPTKDACTTPSDRPGGNPKDVKTLTYKQGKLIVSWAPMPRLQHNGPGFQYIIYWRKKGSTYWKMNNVDKPDAKIWEVGVNDTYGLYEIKVKSQNQIGESRQPAFIHLGYSGEGEPLVRPKDFRLDPLTKVRTHSAHFIWEAVDTSPTKILGSFKGYKIRYWKSSEGRHKWREVDIMVVGVDSSKPDVRAHISDLPAYTALRAQVSVQNTHYTGPPSQTIDFFTPEGEPDPVRNLRIEAHGTTYVLLKWLPPEEPNGQLLGYDIAYKEMDGSGEHPIKALRPQIDNPDTLGARITGLSANHNYRFYVWARTNAGRGKSVFRDVRTEDGKRLLATHKTSVGGRMTPDTPQPKFMTLDQTSVNITWTPYRLIDVTYVLEYRLAGHAHWKMANSEWGRSWMVINDLRPNMEYEVRLIAKNKFGDTASSTLYRVKTQPKRDDEEEEFESATLWFIKEGHDAHKQFDGAADTTGSSSPLHSSVSRTWTVVLHTLLSLVIANVLVHLH